MTAKVKRQSGLTYIEVIVFILFLIIVSAPIFTAFNRIATGIVQPERGMVATQLAKQRMELILGDFDAAGFENFIDPCTGGSPPTECTLPAGYSIAQPTIQTDTNPSRKNITVTVSGTSGAILQMQVTNYNSPNT